MNLVKRIGSGQYPTSQEHGTLQDAQREAKRLALLQPGEAFAVYAPVEVYIAQPSSMGPSATRLHRIRTDSHGRVPLGETLDLMGVPRTFK